MENYNYIPNIRLSIILSFLAVNRMPHRQYRERLDSASEGRPYFGKRLRDFRGMDRNTELARDLRR